MKHFVILPNPKKDVGYAVTAAVAERLISRGAVVYVPAEVTACRGTETYTEFPATAEAVLVVGGDGSVLDAAVTAVKYDLPLLGINLGKVGYLTEVEVGNLSVLDRLLTDDFSVGRMMLLSVSKEERGEVTVSDRPALNDCIVSRSPDGDMADVAVTTSSGEGIAYRADGVIVATPAGSTAYSFSAGGPVVAHDVESLLVTPVCPHAFFNRPILFDSKECIHIRNGGTSQLFVRVDGRPFGTLEPGGVCRVCRSEKTLKMIHLTEGNMFSALFGKIRNYESV